MRRRIVWIILGVPLALITVAVIPACRQAITMMNAILDGRPFMEAVEVGYHRDVHALWQEFAQAGAERK